MGVNGGLGCGLCAESLRRDVRDPTVTGAGGDLARMQGEFSSSEVIDAGGGWLLPCGFSIAHQPQPVKVEHKENTEAISHLYPVTATSKPGESSSSCVTPAPDCYKSFQIGSPRVPKCSQKSSLVPVSFGVSATSFRDPNNSSAGLLNNGSTKRWSLQY